MLALQLGELPTFRRVHVGGEAARQTILPLGDRYLQAQQDRTGDIHVRASLILRSTKPISSEYTTVRVACMTIGRQAKGEYDSRFQQSMKFKGRRLSDYPKSMQRASVAVTASR